MTFKFAAASLLALSLFAAPVVAQDNPEAAPPAVVIPDEILALVNDKRSSQELSDEDLKQRARAARGAAKAEGLPDDVKSQLQALVDSDRAELETRSAAQKPAEQPVQEAAPEPEKKAEEPKQEAAPEPEKKVEEPAQQQAEPEAAPAPVELPADVTALLDDGRAIEDLSDDDLVARAKFAREQSRNKDLPEDVRNKLAGIGKQARQALAAREQAAKDKKPEEPAPQQAEPKVEEPPAPVQEEAQQPAPETAPVVEQPPAAQAAEPPAPAPAPVVDKVEAKELDGNAGNPEAEAKAKAFLDDAATAESLSDDALRQRLDGMRDLMAENELSVKTERALRDKLRSERVVLRDRLAKSKVEEEAKALAAKAEEESKAAADAGEQAPKRDKRPKINIIINAQTPVREVLRDRRDAEELDESELRYRIRARRDFEASEQYRDYDEDQRAEWQQRNIYERKILRARLQEERNIRRVELERPANVRRIVIEDEQDFSDDTPEDVFAAEVEDADIEKALLAPPRQRIARKISVEEYASKPQARKALTRIEVDTIRFGFNEAFVREEEVDSLDQIAAVIERVLKKYPREVFLIEGHTDAVGSDAYNAKLSKARAEAVKKALSTYYIIPARNLQTAGLGERYLKIPTAEAEQENRRVSISRATAVFGEAEE
jgi:outer membrane protein OmpA-like peptidoglycan-associated protein